MAVELRAGAGLMFAALVFGAYGHAQSGDTASKKNSAPDANKPARVHARKLDGFELSAQSGHAGTQIGGASRGAGADILLLAPDKGRTYTLNPLFQWANPDGKINSFEFRLLGPNAETVLYRAEVTGPSFKYPTDATVPLKPGGDYFWTVSALVGEQAEPAEVMVAGGEDRTHLSKDIENTPEASTARAELLVQKRLWYDAIEAYTNLIAEHPGDRQLLLDRAEIYAQLPQTEKAAERDRINADAAAR